uniref:Ion transport domain-containing protein n=1 Tax=Callorhinchus milii TaxID=7868 RepID=A0A4W3HBM0_CALMI
MKNIINKIVGDRLNKRSFEFLKQKGKKKQVIFQQFAKILTKNWFFNGVILTTILVNSLVMALESVESMQMRFYEFFDVMEQFFLAIYIMEFLLKIYAEPIKYWKAGSNTFAFMVLLLCLVERFLTNEQKRAMDLIRAVQPLRTLRTIFFIRGLQTIKSVLYILFLLFLLLFVFALIGFYFFGTGNTGNVDNWSSLRAAFFTLFNLVTVMDHWTDFQAQIVHQGTRWNRIFTIGFILLGCFLFFNLFIGVIIINIRVTSLPLLPSYKEHLRNKKQTIVHRQQEHIKQLMEKQKTTQFESFGEKVQNFKKTLKHDDYIVMDDLCSSLSFIDIYLTNLDQQDDTLYKLQNLYFELSYILGNMLEGESGASALDKKRHS